MKKRLLTVIFVLLFTIPIIPNAYAIDLLRIDGEITVILETEIGTGIDIPLEGIMVGLYRVADAVEAKGLISFNLYGGFVSSGADLIITDAGSHRAQAELLEKYAKDNGLAPIATEISDIYGKAVFTGLGAGLYLIAHESGGGMAGVNSEYLMMPVLVPMPDIDKGAWTWDIAANPKTEPIPKTPPPEEPRPETAPAAILIDGDKNIVAIGGVEIPERGFTFVASQVDSLGAAEYTGPGIPMTASAAITGAGAFTIELGGLEAYASPYFFLVTEDQTGDGEDGWSYSGSRYWVRADVTDMGDGTSSAAITAKVDSDGFADAIVFTNTYGIIISCEVNKDTIKRTSAAYVSLPGYEGFNNVGKTDEMFRYDIDFRSTSNVDVDEFVVDDPLENVRLNHVRVELLWTPIVWGDIDGTFNLWYRTNMTDDSAVYSDVAANRAITDPVFTNTGFKLWAQGLSATSRVKLDVTDLGLAEGEYITAMRFEYGAVKVGFTSMNYARTAINGEHRSESHGPLVLQANNVEILQEAAPQRPPNFINSIFGNTVDWTPDAKRHDYAEGAANAAGLQPISYMVSAVKPMYDEDIINSAISRIALGELNDWDQDAVVTRLISTFGVESQEFVTTRSVERSFIDNAESLGWNLRNGEDFSDLVFSGIGTPLDTLEYKDSYDFDRSDIPAAGSDNPGTRGVPSGGSAPQTGDTTMLDIWILMMALSATAILVLLILRKHKV